MMLIISSVPAAAQCAENCYRCACLVGFRLCEAVRCIEQLSIRIKHLNETDNTILICRLRLLTRVTQGGDLSLQRLDLATSMNITGQGRFHVFTGA